MPKSLYKNLTFQVVAAIVIGGAIGHFRPDWGVALQPLGDGFIRLIKMVVGPIIFLTIVCGIASMSDMKKVGRVGIKALIYFELVTTVALAIGLIVANVFQPGTRDGRGIAEAVPANEATPLESTANESAVAAAPSQAAKAQVERYTQEAQKHSFVDFLLNIIPDNVVNAFAKGDLLQILFFSVMVGVAMSGLGLGDGALMNVLEQMTEVMFRIVAIIMKVGPLGAFGAIAYTIGKFGIASLGPLAKLLGCAYLTMILFIVIGLGAVCRLYGISLWQYLRFIREEIVLVLGTSSSESALPRMIEKLELMGCSRSVVGLVIPTGYSFNLDGTSIYLSMALIFIAQAYGVQMTLGQQLYAMGILMLTSKGAAAVTGGGFVTLAATMDATKILPDEATAGLALLLGVDRFMSAARAITNLIGNGVATIVVSKMEGEFDQKRFDAAIAGHALDAPPPGGFSPEVIGDVAGDPESVDPEVGNVK